MPRGDLILVYTPPVLDAIMEDTESVSNEVPTQAAVVKLWDASSMQSQLHAKSAIRALYGIQTVAVCMGGYHRGVYISNNEGDVRQRASPAILRALEISLKAYMVLDTKKPGSTMRIDNIDLCIPPAALAVLWTMLDLFRSNGVNISVSTSNSATAESFHKHTVESDLSGYSCHLYRASYDLTYTVETRTMKHGKEAWLPKDIAGYCW